MAIPSYNVEQLLIEQLENPENWEVVEAPGTSSMVVLRDRGDDEPARIHPGGAVTFRQNVVPFNLKIDKFGAGTVEGRDLFQIEATRVGNGPNNYDESDDIGEWFAPAEYLKMKDAEKLKAPAYEFFDCGAQIGGGAPQFGNDAIRETGHEEITIDPAINSRIQQSGKRVKRNKKLSEKILAECVPHRTPDIKPTTEISLKAAATAFTDARFPGLKRNRPQKRAVRR